VHASHRSVLGLALVLGAAILAYRGVPRLELLGWDTYPTIAASRIGSASDLADTLREELMDGRYPGGRFYRPLTNLIPAQSRPTPPEPGIVTVDALPLPGPLFPGEAPP